jgi:hypothetical protein
MEYVWFFFSALLIVLAGNKLVAYGDTLAVHTTLGYGLVGGILIAGVTSLPELERQPAPDSQGQPHTDSYARNPADRCQYHGHLDDPLQFF